MWQYTSYEYATGTIDHKNGQCNEVHYPSLVPPSYAMDNISCIEVYKRPEDGSRLEPKYVAMNTIIKLVLCV